MSITTVTAIIKDCCEAEPSDPDHPDTICISVSDLEIIVARNLEVVILSDDPLPHNTTGAATMTTPKTDAIMALADRYAFHIPGSQHSDEARAALLAALHEQAREGEAVAPSAILARGRFHAFKGEDGEPDDWEWFEEGTNCEHGCIDAVIVRADAIAAPQPAQPVALPLTPEELDLCRQWFNSVQDVNGGYLTTLDYVLAEKLYRQLNMRVPNSISEITKSGIGGAL